MFTQQPANINKLNWMPAQSPQSLSYGNMIQLEKIKNYFMYRNQQAQSIAYRNRPVDVNLMMSHYNEKYRNNIHDYLLDCEQQLYSNEVMQLKEYSLFCQNLKLFDNHKVQQLIEISHVGFKFARPQRLSMESFVDFFEETYSREASEKSFVESEIDCIWNQKESPSFTTAKSSVWKEPIVLDPSISPPYDNAFPSLHSIGSKKKGIEKNIVSLGNGRTSWCVFCKNNSEPPEVYLSHLLKDFKTGKTTCPILRKYLCTYCNATGDNAHTRSYCPKRILERMNQVAVSYQMKQWYLVNKTV